jgi:hypothetical protein
MDRTANRISPEGQMIKKKLNLGISIALVTSIKLPSSAPKCNTSPEVLSMVLKSQAGIMISSK